MFSVLLYDQPVGTLSHLPGDKNLFTFNESYINDPLRPTLSLFFKGQMGELISQEEMTQTRLSPFFSNLLPEGTLREYLAQRANINPIHEFSLLEVLGRDLPGALTVLPMEGSLPPAETVNETNKKKKNAPLRFSLAGVQLKFSAIEKKGEKLAIPLDGVGGRWIIKLPHSLFPEVPENEYSMMELARKVGIDVPDIALHPIKDLQGLPPEFERLGNTIYAIKRFDRTEREEKIHIEDFAQVFGVYPENKYKSASYRNIAEVIWRETGESGIVEFIRRFVFNALIGNGDMHLKNWSLIYRDKRKATLAPAYDFVSTILYLPNDQLALNFMRSKNFDTLSINQFKRFATKAQLPEELVLKTVDQTVAAFAEAWKTVKDLPLGEETRNAIEKHLRTIPLWTS